VTARSPIACPALASVAANPPGRRTSEVSRSTARRAAARMVEKQAPILVASCRRRPPPNREARAADRGPPKSTPRAGLLAAAIESAGQGFGAYCAVQNEAL